MDFESYLLYFESVLLPGHTLAPYTDPAYHNYAKLNWSRQQRWLKVGELNSELTEVVKKISRNQHWVVITEAWCGDAAHILPFIYKLTQLNPLLRLDIQLRDSEPFAINNYLTGTSKSIPKLVIRDANDNDLLVWGPRPRKCQELYNQLKAEHADSEETKKQIQGWYNQDKGVSFQEELLAALLKI
ncbi:MAG: thioredoxin family protein [Bacteroidota bacterium]